MDLFNSVTRNFEWKIHNFTQEVLAEGRIVKTPDFQIVLENNVTKW